MKELLQFFFSGHKIIFFLHKNAPLPLIGNGCSPATSPPNSECKCLKKAMPLLINVMNYLFACFSAPYGYYFDRLFND